MQEDYGKLVEAPELADVVLVVEGERFPAHRNVLAARSEYFRGLLLSGMQEGSGQQEIPLEEVSVGAFRVVLRYLYTAAVPAWEELQGTGTGAKGGGAAVGGHGGRGKGVGQGQGQRGGGQRGGRGGGTRSAGAESAKGGGPFPGRGAVEALPGGVPEGADSAHGGGAASVGAQVRAGGGAGRGDRFFCCEWPRCSGALFLIEI